MRLNSPLSITARLFQPQATLPLALVDDVSQNYPVWNGLARAALPWASPLIHLWDGHPLTTITPLMRMGCPLIPLSLGGHSIGGVVAEEIEATGVVVTPMRLLLPEGDGRKRMGSLVRFRSQSLGARRAILMMWLTPLGSGPVVSCIIMSTMRIPTSCP